MRTIRITLDRVLFVIVLAILAFCFYDSLTSTETHQTVKQIWDKKYPANSEANKY